MQDNKIGKLVTAAMLAALCCVATMTIRVPTIATNGYVNVGDAVVLLGAWLLGGFYGALAGGIGSAMADMLSGYMHYVPGTFVIKGLMGVVAFLIFKAVVDGKRHRTFGYILSAIAAEVVMILGYFTYQSLILGYGIGASASIPGNITQGITCAVIAVACISVLDASRIPQRLFARQQ